MKTWICDIYGAGTPLYLVSTENEKNAWKLIKDNLRNQNNDAYWKMSFDLEKNSGGLIEFPYFKSEQETIIDINEIYATHGLLHKGTYKGL